MLFSAALHSWKIVRWRREGAKNHLIHCFASRNSNFLLLLYAQTQTAWERHFSITCFAHYLCLSYLIFIKFVFLLGCCFMYQHNNKDVWVLLCLLQGIFSPKSISCDGTFELSLSVWSHACGVANIRYICVEEEEEEVPCPSSVYFNSPCINTQG